MFHVAYTYISIKFFMKRSSSLITKMFLIWRLSDFSSVANLPGIPVPGPKSDLKTQKLDLLVFRLKKVCENATRGKLLVMVFMSFPIQHEDRFFGK